MSATPRATAADPAAPLDAAGVAKTNPALRGLRAVLALLGAHRRQIFWAGVVAQCGIVVTGALVRLTGSGLGCPTWPECTAGSVVPVAHQAQGIHVYIEFGNRMLTTVLTVVVLLCIGAAVGRVPRRRPLVVFAALGIVGIAAQAALGGLTVLTKLNPWYVAAHFLLSMVLIAVSVALLERDADAGDAPAVPRVRSEIRVLGRVLVGLAAVVLTLGTVVTGSGPHSGDADEPARNGFDPRSVSWLHADSVLLFIGLVVAVLLALHLTDADRDIKRRGWFLAAMVLVQGAIGYIQYFAGLPVGVVALHVVGACLVWVATLRLLFGMRSRGATRAVNAAAVARAAGETPAAAE